MACFDVYCTNIVSLRESKSDCIVMKHLIYTPIYHDPTMVLHTKSTVVVPWYRDVPNRTAILLSPKHQLIKRHWAKKMKKKSVKRKDPAAFNTVSSNPLAFIFIQSVDQQVNNTLTHKHTNTFFVLCVQCAESRNSLNLVGIP